MKKGILLLIGLMSIASIKAKNIKISNNKINYNYPYNNAVTFVERGIRFHVFLNGDFDFNTNIKNNYYHNNIRDIQIERDYDGRIRRIGNVFINYNFRGDVKRIGNVFIDYKFGQLSRVGNLRIYYNQWGEPFFKGAVKSRNYYNDDYDRDNCEVKIDINISGNNIFDYNDVYFFQRDFTNNYRQFKEDENFLYYKNSDANTGRKSKIIKRKRNFNSSLYKPEQHGKSRRSRY